MRFYATQYRLQDPSNSEKRILFNSAVYAKTYGHACKLAVMRGIGEFVVGVVEDMESYNPCPLPSIMYKNRKMIECLHTLTFYSWIAVSAKVIEPTQPLSDVGLVHELMHEIQHPNFYNFRQEILDRICAFETLVPGLKSYIFPENFSQSDSVENHLVTKITAKNQS